MFAHSRELTQNGSSTSRIHVRSAIMSDTATMTSKQNPLHYVTDQLKDMREKGVAPKLRVLEGEQRPVCIFDGREVINLASNNYLGLTTHKALRKAALDAVKRVGVGAGAARTIAGTMKMHMELEEQIARFKQSEACVVFQSGFAANAGTVSAILGKEDLIISDELNHASIIDGARLSKATIKVFKHKDTADCERILKETENWNGKKLLITDGVFSMDGDIANLPALCDLAEKYNCIMMVDDAHSSGVLGSRGRGTIDHLGCHSRVDIQVGTLSKAIGSIGRQSWWAKQPKHFNFRGSYSLKEFSPARSDFPRFLKAKRACARLSRPLTNA